MEKILALDICHLLIGLVQAVTSWSAWIDAESAGGGAGGERNLNMQEEIIPYPDKPIKHNEIVSYYELVATKVGCTWKNTCVPYTLSARTDDALPYLDLFQNQLT